jgi:hypothetical protein
VRSSAYTLQRSITWQIFYLEIIRVLLAQGICDIVCSVLIFCARNIEVVWFRCRGYVYNTSVFITWTLLQRNCSRTCVFNYDIDLSVSRFPKSGGHNPQIHSGKFCMQPFCYPQCTNETFIFCFSFLVFAVVRSCIYM